MELTTTKKILLELLIKKETSRKELEDALNITSSTLSYTLKKIKDYILISNKKSIGLGRPTQYVLLNPNYWYSVGIKVGRDYINATIFNSKFEILEKNALKITKEYMGNENISKLLDSVLSKLSLKDKIKSIGIAFSGNVIDKKVNSYILKLKDYSPKDIIKKHFGNIPFTILNDVEAIATEEFVNHAGEKILVLNYGTGIGACYLESLDYFNKNYKKIIELGHFYAGGNEKCYCGSTGCLETLASEYAILKKYKFRDLKITEFIENEEQYEIDLKEIRKLYKNFKKKAEIIYEDVFKHLTVSIINTFKLLSPKKIILTGEGVTPWFSQVLQKKVLSVSKEPIPIVYRGIESNIELGAAITALQYYIIQSKL
ncbi:ROK family transcriptional regulator [Thermosipho affectus]|uniref:ROK family transcriptional regulator n=1 Tax=Thermosipho affectus TaxID=660294 RepID=A0ABX3IJC2_9BACT|nr:MULTISPECIES: ROK family transcriptional regulator [Thermosipho]ANQ53051.1 ROK family transcriptional regulator [Thermosipho sp. 1070]APT71500.1 ROK family transcriptional regulator [Thermosipho sp. 1063]ONN27920.1 ROK family transcriptional regulator [Thermosipho affectus]